MNLPPTGLSETAPSGAIDTRSRHIGVLDGLRALSILLVLAAHLLPLGPKPLQFNVAAGSMGMSLFFALSGFLIMRALTKSNVFEFIVMRAARVLPLAFAYVLVVALLFPMSLSSLIASLGLYLNYRPDLMLPVTEHLWSLGVELHFYAAIALIAAFNRKAVVPLLWIGCLSITGLKLVEGVHTSIITHLRVDEILIGACVATLPERFVKSSSHARPLWFGAAIVWMVTSHPGMGAVQYLRPYAAGCFLAVTLMLPMSRVGEWLSSPVARYIAAISFALYVIHPLFAHGWWNSGSDLERYLFKRPLGLAITLVLAHLSSFYWEAFWRKTARRWLASHKDRQPRPSLTTQARSDLSGS
jgi:peptidoglycan/LPS O-acetylase OafA/YrhL